ncbi:16S rRNA (uracil(1498)-N(3))-methyltransferase [soil metagenome]
MRRFFASPAQFTSDSVVLDEGETRHLRDVLRLQPGDIVHVFDGVGREFECSVQEIKRKSSVVQVISEVPPSAPESPLRMTLAAAVTPGEKFDLVVQKAVELGVFELQPLITARTEVKADVAIKRMDRWTKIVFEASKQCGRARLMPVNPPILMDDLFDPEKTYPDLLFFSEREGKRTLPAKLDGVVTAVIGPKGGWDDREIAIARESNCSIITFGGRILRAETASIAITAIIQHRFGDLN